MPHVHPTHLSVYRLRLTHWYAVQKTSRKWQAERDLKRQILLKGEAETAARQRLERMAGAGMLTRWLTRCLDKLFLKKDDMDLVTCLHVLQLRPFPAMAVWQYCEKQRACGF